MASDDIKPLLSDQDIDDIILTGSHRNAAGGIYATSVYAFAKEVAIAAIKADRERRASGLAAPKTRAEIADALRYLASRMQVVGSAMDRFGGFDSKLAGHGREMFAAGLTAGEWANAIEDEKNDAEE